MVCAAMVCALASTGCSTRSSDERSLRREFAIPRAAEVASYSASPSESGWFGREGLKIEIVFQLSDRDYAAYVTRAEAAGTWRAFPIPTDLLRRMGAVKTAKASIARSYSELGRPLPAEGSVYNPTEQQMLDRFVASLPRQPRAGRFQVRWAGTDILHAPKTIRTQLDHDLNDLMLAMLDDDWKRITIKVSTRY